MLVRSGGDSVTLGITAGLLAALIGVSLTWLVSDGSSLTFRQIVLAGVVPAVLGFLLAGWPDISAGAFGRGLLFGARGLAAGAASGLIGFALADQIFWAVSDAGGNTQLGLVLGWVIVAAFIGTAVGALFAAKKALTGLVGGILGGLCGGSVLWLFDIGRDAPFGEMLLAIAAAASIVGIGIGGIERFTRSAWIDVVDGPLAGKQYVLYGPETVAGSGRSCEISLAADQRAEERHAMFRCDSGAIFVRPLDGAVLVNGQPISGEVEVTGAQVTVGSSHLRPHTQG